MPNNDNPDKDTALMAAIAREHGVRDGLDQAMAACRAEVDEYYRLDIVPRKEPEPIEAKDVRSLKRDALEKAIDAIRDLIAESAARSLTLADGDADRMSDVYVRAEDAVVGHRYGVLCENGIVRPCTFAGEQRGGFAFRRDDGGGVEFEDGDGVVDVLPSVEPCGATEKP